MRKKKAVKLPIKLIVLTIIFVVVISFLLLTPGVEKTKAEAKKTKQTQVEAAKEGEETCSMIICKDYVGFKYDKVNDKCYCYDENGVAVERNSAEKKDTIIETTKNAGINNTNANNASQEI